MSGRGDSPPEADQPSAENPALSGRWDSPPEAPARLTSTMKAGGDAPTAQNQRSFDAECATREHGMSGRPDSNRRPLGPEPSALAGLRYAPKSKLVFRVGRDAARPDRTSSSLRKVMQISLISNDVAPFSQ